MHCDAHMLAAAEVRQLLPGGVACKRIGLCCLVRKTAAPVTAKAVSA